MTPSLTATLTETPTASPTWIETLVTTITGTALTPSPVSTDAPLGVPTIKPDDALATPTLGPTVTFPVMPGIELTPALAFPSPAALALDLEP
ncbi:MAG: hypothetical protein SF123_26135, partial [Chloroflexota bacterium]|nr:hypothetical protein [Chloroflexota bacterium]